MEYRQLLTEVIGRVGVITLNNPPRNAFSKRMIAEMLDILDRWENDNAVRTVYVKSTGEDFSVGADAEDIRRSLAGEPEEIPESFSVLGGRLVERIDTYPKSTIVAARGRCIGGSTAVFNSFDIRIVSDTFRIHDGDIYYGTIGSWGMSSLRLPIWIGRNKIMDYMFLNDDFTGLQAYELGIASRCVPDAELDEQAWKYAQKMSTAAPLAVRYFKECVRTAATPELAKAREFELKAAEIVFATEDSRNGLAAVIRGEQAEFKGK